MSHQIPGVAFQLGGRSLVLPPLSLAEARARWARIVELTHKAAEPTFEDLEFMALTAASALRRNHPDITDEFVLEHADVEIIGPLFSAVMGRGAFKRWMEQSGNELGAQGNAPALLATTTAGTGAPSTPPSQPPVDGASGTSTN